MAAVIPISGQPPTGKRTSKGLAAIRATRTGKSETVSDLAAPTISAITAMTSPDLLAEHFSGPSWSTWRAILKASEGQSLTPAELAAFRAIADRDPPGRRVRELWVLGGRRSGKDSVASLIATAMALGDYRRHLRAGERASVLCLAVSREQARIVHRYISAYFTENPILKPLLVRETEDTLELSNNVEIVIATNNYRSVRGRSFLCCILDECAFWRSEDSATPDIETYQALLPGMVTIPGAMLVGITSVYRKAGLAYDKWRKHYGQDDPDILVVKGPSTAFNPTLPQSIIDAALERDLEAASAEWLSEWRSDISGFLDRELIEACVEFNTRVRQPQQRFKYVAFSDPSGGRGDSFTSAIAHAEEQNVAVLDAIYERRAPFDPQGVVAEIAEFLRSYRVTETTGDKYAAEWVVTAFRRERITYKSSRARPLRLVSRRAPPVQLRPGEAHSQ